MDEKCRRETRLAIARVDGFIAKSARLLERVETGGDIPDREAFHQAELESLDRTLETLVSTLLGGPVSEDTWMSPGAFAWRHGLPTSDRFAWLRALHAGLTASKSFLEALMRADDITAVPHPVLTEPTDETARSSQDVPSSITTHPRVFISYSHDSPAHKEWVRRLAERLVNSGIDVKLDVWDAGLGSDLARFMEDGVRASDRVLTVCTEAYVEKADRRKGGVGYEAMIVGGELIRDLGTDKFVPIVRQSASRRRLPVSLSSRLYIDFSDDKDFETALEELLRELHDSPRHPKPPLGKNPFLPDPASPPDPGSTSAAVRPQVVAPSGPVAEPRSDDHRKGAEHPHAKSPDDNPGPSTEHTPDETTFEQWKRRLLNNPLIAAAVLFTIFLGGVVAVKEGYEKIFPSKMAPSSIPQGDVTEEIGFRIKQIDTVLQDAERLQAKCFSELDKVGTVSGACVRDYLQAAQVVSVAFQLGGIYSPPGRDDDTVSIGSSGFGLRHLPTRRSHKFAAYSELDMKDLLKNVTSNAWKRTPGAATLIDQIEGLAIFSEVDVLDDWFKRHQAQGQYQAIYGNAYKVYDSRLDDYAEELAAVRAWLDTLANAWRQFETGTRS